MNIIYIKRESYIYIYIYSCVRIEYTAYIYIYTYKYVHMLHIIWTEYGQFTPIFSRTLLFVSLERQVFCLVISRVKLAPTRRGSALQGVVTLFEVGGLRRPVVAEPSGQNLQCH